MIDQKNIWLTSAYLFSQDSSDMKKTVIDGDGQGAAVTIKNTTTALRIVGMTVRNAEDGILPTAPFTIIHCIVTGTSDGIDYETGSGGICRHNIFENNQDDGLDLDEDVEVFIEDNLIRNNQGDGIEIRLQPYQGRLLAVTIRGNSITDNAEDGIQFVDYPGLSHRSYLVISNVIAGNQQAGIGLMGEAQSKETYEGADVPEPILVINNVMDGNEYGISGGDNMQVLNNIIMHTKAWAISKVNGNSTVAYNILWKNQQDYTDTNLNIKTTIFADPMLSSHYIPDTDSPAIRAGTPDCEHDAGERCTIGLIQRDGVGGR